MFLGFNKIRILIRVIIREFVFFFPLKKKHKELTIINIERCYKKRDAVFVYIKKR